MIDERSIYSNDIDAIRRSYGVEAARATILREIRGVFDVYKIDVDLRHLELIADYMVCHLVSGTLSRRTTLTLNVIRRSTGVIARSTVRVLPATLHLSSKLHLRLPLHSYQKPHCTETLTTYDHPQGTSWLVG